MSRTQLIVNADDANLTRGVNRAILKAHDQGILTSTTWMVNLPTDKREVASFLKRKKLGIGIHLNITLGQPVSKAKDVRSLLMREECFRRLPSYRRRKPKPSEVLLEWEAQIKKFKSLFKRLPTHFDTHHQVHDYEPFYSSLVKFAKKYKRPIRRSKRMKKVVSVRTSDTLWGSLLVQGAWTSSKFQKVIQGLGAGVHEVMTHPGYADRDLKAISSMTTERSQELKVIASTRWRSLLKKSNIELINYGNVK